MFIRNTNFSGEEYVSYGSDRFQSDSYIWNNNECAAAWLASPSQWENYKDTTGALKDYVNYAIGAPSAEMYCDSYNQAFEKVQDETTGKGIIATRYYSTTPANYPSTWNANAFRESLEEIFNQSNLSVSDLVTIV